jgi:hypothetical protein
MRTCALTALIASQARHGQVLDRHAAGQVQLTQAVTEILARLPERP